LLRNPRVKQKTHMNARKLTVPLYFLTEHAWSKVMQTTVELGYNITKGAEYFVFFINECSSNREVLCNG